MVSDIFLILFRYLEIKKTNLSVLKQMSKKLILFICISLPIIIALPAFFSVEISINESGLYVKKFTNFGSSRIFSIYFIGVFALENVIPVIIISFLNVASVLKFKIYMEAHGRLTQKQVEAKKSEIRLTRLVIFLTAICIVTRLLDLISTVLNRLTYIDESLFSPSGQVLIRFFIDIKNIFLYVVQALDGLVIITMDKNIMPLISKMLGLKKVSIKIN